MKATLVYPGFTSCGWNSLGRSDNNEANFVPLGLAWLSASAKKAGHEIDAIDLRTLSGWDDVNREIADRSPGCFAISCLTVDYQNACELARRIKGVHGENFVLMGGAHATLVPKSFLSVPEIDCVLTGEGEITFPHILGELERGGRPSRLVHSTYPDLDSLPWPDRDLWRFRESEHTHPLIPQMPRPFVTILTARGCPFNCNFCQPGERLLSGGRWRYRSVPNVIEELDHLRSTYGFEYLMIHDQLFTANPKRVIEFCRAYKEAGFTQKWFCQTRADIFCKFPNMVEAMVDAGLDMVIVGFESGNDRVLKFMRKGTTMDQNRQMVDMCRHHGIKIWANYILGLPTETPQEVMDTVRFVNWMKPFWPSPSFFTPIPGTDLADYCVEEELAINPDLDGRRNPLDPKIKGTDYEFLRWALEKSHEYRIREDATRIQAEIENANGNRKSLDAGMATCTARLKGIEEGEKRFRAKYALDPSPTHGSGRRRYASEISLISVLDKESGITPCGPGTSSAESRSLERILVLNGAGTPERNSSSGAFKTVVNEIALPSEKAMNQGARLAAGEWLVFRASPSHPLRESLGLLVDEARSRAADVLEAEGLLLVQSEAFDRLGGFDVSDTGVVSDKITNFCIRASDVGFQVVRRGQFDPIDTKTI